MICLFFLLFLSKYCWQNIICVYCLIYLGGDLHLQTYGVSCVPDVAVLDLQAMFANRDSSIDPTSPALLLVCSDGVWDNWKFQDVVQYFKGNKY